MARRTAKAEALQAARAIGIIGNTSGDCALPIRRHFSPRRDVGNTADEPRAIAKHIMKNINIVAIIYPSRTHYSRIRKRLFRPQHRNSSHGSNYYGVIDWRSISRRRRAGKPMAFLRAVAEMSASKIQWMSPAIRRVGGVLGITHLLYCRLGAKARDVPVLRAARGGWRDALLGRGTCMPCSAGGILRPIKLY